MNSRQLAKLGIPNDCVPAAISAIQQLNQTGRIRKPELKQMLEAVVAAPDDHVGHPLLGHLASQIVAIRDFVPPAPVEFQTWGESYIDHAAKAQMKRACELPVAVRGALMPDAHVGYGLPIGGVLACNNAVVPYAVGVDIACRMKISLLDMSLDTLRDDRSRLANALQRGTRFGIGVEHEKPQHHPVLDEDWTITATTRAKRDVAWRQLGTSGSGNHFVEFGKVTLDVAIDDMNIAAGEYLGLLSHSGSRGAGAAVCQFYSNVARKRVPSQWESLAHLAWLDLDSEAGQEYWQAMNLMGLYAAANHDVIHRLVAGLLGAERIASIENHHNFAWLEEHDGKQLVVHRKGATPAGRNDLGIIPGTMSDPAFIVRGKGNSASLCSASHGAGRTMSRREARDRFRIKAVAKSLENDGVDVLSAGSDEVPAAYKNIHDVMAAQNDLVETLGRFQPLVVKMCGDGSRAED